MGIKKTVCAALAASLAIAAAGCGEGGEVSSSVTENKDRVFHNYPVYNGVDFPLELWQKPEYEYCPEYDCSGGGYDIKGVWLRNDYDGQESYAFAYLGTPEGVTDAKKAPAVLLVHGGGGTAYREWVRAWNDRGYVALAIDTEGHIPLPTGTVNDGPAELYEKSEYVTPHNQNYADADKLPVEQTWMYYAVTTAITGNSFLHSLSFVDKQAIGICGISWGGVITSIVTGYDDRFAFSIPIYCTLNNAGTACNMGSYLNNHPNALVWDDDLGLSAVETPILFLAGIDDVNQTADTVTKTAERCKNARISLVKGFLHSHGHAIAQNEPFAFADEIVFGKKTMPVFTDTLEDGETAGELTFTLPQGVAVEKAYLIYTPDVVSQGSADWDFVRLTVGDGKVRYDLAEAGEGTKEFYVYLVADNGLIVSTRIAKA
ncbi:MAG: dienelactone hydrolase family protein [Candidatus Borkfalkiaceae bacterium]|nr:dienelactone hydrolase family protein [Christensenellaceae bacterium]